MCTCRLSILCNFPETCSLQEYMSLLPAADTDPSKPPVLPWIQHAWREADWVEDPHVQAVIDPIPDDKGAFLYEDNPQYTPFR